MAQLLIGAGANVNGYGFLGTPLHAAAFGGHLELAELLIAKGADVDARNSSARTVAPLPLP